MQFDEEPTAPHAARRGHEHIGELFLWLGLSIDTIIGYKVIDAIGLTVTPHRWTTCT